MAARLSNSVSRRRGGQQRGFTLLEVVIALGILAISLSVLLESQATSLRNAGRTRDLTIATLLARSKMVDIERELFDEGFTTNAVEDEGDFEEEGWKDFEWKSKVSEIEMDLSSLSGMCAGAGEGEGGGECESMLSGAGVPMGALTEEIAHSLRVVDLQVSWPAGHPSESMSVRSLVTREDFALEPAAGGGVELPPGVEGLLPTAPPAGGQKR